MAHIHHFEPYEKNALCYYTKRDDGQTDDARGAYGLVTKCRYCPTMMFHKAGLTSVEVELATAEDLARLDQTQTAERRKSPRTRAA